MQNNVSHKIVDSRVLAEMLRPIYKNGGELSFATQYDTYENGVIINQSVNDWYGMRFVKFFDGECLLVGQYGGGWWYAHDVENPTVRMLEEIIDDLFECIEVDEVCVDEPDSERGN